MLAHKITTFERGGGYAARCDTCGDLTFGGFPTRTAARAALVHEEAPGTAATVSQGDIDPNTHEGNDMTSMTDTTRTVEWNRPHWDAYPADDLDERVEVLTATGQLVMNWGSKWLIDGELSVALTREDVRDEDGTITEGPTQLAVWAGGNHGFNVQAPQDLLRFAHRLRDAARAAAVLIAQDAGRRTFDLPPRYLPEITELHVIECEYLDGSSETICIPAPSRIRPDEADVAQPGDWWLTVDPDTRKPQGRRTYVARVQRVEGFDDLWVEVDAVPLEGYRGRMPHRPTEAGA